MVSERASHRADTRDICPNTLDVRIFTPPIVENAVNASPFIVQHVHDISVEKSFGSFKQIKEIFINGKTGLIKSGKLRTFAEFQI